MFGNLRKVLGLYTYQSLNSIELSKDRLLKNYKQLDSLSPHIKVAPVLKSNGYGHGIVEVAKILDSLDTFHLSSKPPFFCVDSLYEAYELTKANIKTPILIMGYVDPENLKVKRLPFSYAVWDLRSLNGVYRFQPQAGIHIFVDTGMNREGVRIEDLPRFISYFGKFPNLKVEGLMSHLAQADKLTSFKKQLTNFRRSQEMVSRAGFQPRYYHILNSDGLLNLKSNQILTRQVGTEITRLGLALYGVSQNNKLKPVLKFTTKLICIKRLKKGEWVGYAGTFKAKKDMILGVLPAGYNDGVDRRLSNKGVVTINGKSCPIIGLVNMNLTTIDLSLVKYPKIGQEVVIYSDNPKDKNSIQNSAKLCKTIPYELLIHLHPSTKRTVI